MFKLFALAALIAVCQASLIAPAPTVLAAPAVAVASPGLVLAPVANYASHTTLHTAPARILTAPIVPVAAPAHIAYGAPALHAAPILASPTLHGQVLAAPALKLIK